MDIVVIKNSWEPIPCLFTSRARNEGLRFIARPTTSFGVDLARVFSLGPSHCLQLLAIRYSNRREIDGMESQHQ